MKCKTKLLLLAVICALALPLAFAGGAGAAIRYVDDGAVQNFAGGFDLPAQGTCPVDTNQGTRADCLALRFPAYTTSADCTNAATGGANRSWSTGSCNDLVNTTQAACEAQPDRKYSNGICAIVMLDDDRNNVTCALHGGTWVTAGTCTGNWIMPARTAYTPNLLTSNGTGDQCLRCHNSRTQYNSPRVRDTEDTLYMGHKNMSRKVTPGMPWGGPPFACSNPLYMTEESCFNHLGTWDPTVYPSDDTGNIFNWVTGQITVGGIGRDLTWIYGDWLSALPRAIYKTDPSTSQVCTDPRYTTSNCVANGGTLVNNAGQSYSCGRCHTTGWTSDLTIATAATDSRLTKEPERSFSGITWDRTSNAGFGVVNLSGGVTGDPNKYSSWDTFGIVCSRCHSSAIDTTTGTGTPPQYSAPAGMSSHHSDMTSPDASPRCTNGTSTSESACTTAGATWTTGYCSDSRFTGTATYTQCLAAGATWLTVCSNGSSLDQTACTAAGGTWNATSSCSVAGVCNNPLYTTQTTCEAAGAQWAAASDIIRCDDAGGRWTGSKTNRGQIITALCMNCHRQETGGLPYDSSNPAGVLKVGPAHGTVGFVSHPHGNQFLNSPHGKFSGRFDQIATGKFNFAMTGEYKSFFLADGEAANTGNGCTGCHEVHTSTVTGEKPFREECTACHTKNLGRILHPSGGGTPMEKIAQDPMEPCVVCHMPDGTHLFRINSSASYSTYPSGALTATVNANTSPDGTYTNAVWVDIDAACGQCHGGGNGNHGTTIGSITSGGKTLTVANPGTIAAGDRIRVVGAGSLYYDDQGRGFNTDFDTFVASVSGNTVTLAGNAAASVTNAAVLQNPIKNGAGYLSKAELAVYAAGIHNDKPTATFGYTIDPSNGLTVNVDASASMCINGPCDQFSWNWGDGTPAGLGVTTSHTYATAGTKTITLTVTEYGSAPGVVSKTVSVYAPDFPPVAGSTFTWNANTWTATLVDTSTDDKGVSKVTVNWGDGSLVSTGAVGGTFTHTYLNAGTYTITQKVIDTIGQMGTVTQTVSPAYFTVSGTVYQSNGTTPAASAMVQLKKGTTIVKTVYTASNGTFTAGTLKPGTYTLTVTKSGFTFTVPAATVTIGPSSSGNNINAVTP